MSHSDYKCQLGTNGKESQGSAHLLKFDHRAVVHVKTTLCAGGVGVHAAHQTEAVMLQEHLETRGTHS